MTRFTKKALSLAVASFVTMTSVLGSSNFAKAETTTIHTPADIATSTAATTPVVATGSSVQTHLSANFTAPSNWTNVYAYAYYVEKGATKAEDKIIEPLGCWPGTKLEKGTNNTYPVKFDSSIGSAKIIFVNADNVSETISVNDNGGYYRECEELHRLPFADNNEDTEEGYTIIGDVTINPIIVSFSAPESWDNVYAYAYYTDSKMNLQEPLGYWPGTKLEKGSDGTYNTSILSSIGEARYIFTNIDESVTPISEAELLPNEIGGYYYNVTKKAQLPEDNGDTNAENGYKVTEGESVLKSEIVPTPGPISTIKPTVVPTITPTVTPTLSPTVTPSAIPTVTPSAVPTATPVIVPTVTPSAIPTVIPSVVPTVTPIIVPTIIPSTVPTATPVIVPTVTPSTIPTATPVIVPTVTPTIAPTITPTVMPTIVPTITPVVTSSALPTVTPDVLEENPVPNKPVNVSTSSALKGTISFDKTKKTVGETIKIKVTAKNGKGPYKYTYYVTKGNTRTTLASNTKSKSVNWKPKKKGTYTISVKITDAKKKSVTIKKKYTVKSAVVTIKSFKANKPSGQKIKTKIVLRANASVKKGKASYKFAVKRGNGKMKVIKKFSSKKKVTWKPTKKGTYTLYVYVKNGKGITVTKTITFKIK